MPMQTLINYMNANILVALGDVHTNNNARTLTKNLIKSGSVNILFIEWSNINLINDVIKSLIDNNSNYDDAMTALINGKYFETLNRDDVSPSLLELTALAISNKVRVAACDLSPSETLSMISLFRKIENYDEPKITVLFDDEGLSVRDDFAVTQIDKYSGDIRRGRLMLWGDKHFKDYENRYLKYNYRTLQPQERFDVRPNNLLKKLKTTSSVFDVIYVPNNEIHLYL